MKTDLLDLALHAHGGLPRWRGVSHLDVRLTMWGGLYTVKGYPEGMPEFLYRMHTAVPRASISPYARPDWRGHFDADRSWIAGQDNIVVAARQHSRASFAGHSRATPWDQLQRLYFTAYALWNYFATPFLFAGDGFVLTELEPHEENAELWRRLHVIFPAHIPTHCKEQTFYFNATGLLQRIDYVTDVLGGIASHYCYDHVAFSGLVYPTLRRVVQRLPTGPRLSGPTSFVLQVADVFVA